MARIYEYQGKEVLRKLDIPTPAGEVAATAEEAREAAARIGKPVVLKAQVWATGRFKAGGIKFAQTPEEAAALADTMLKSEIKGLAVSKLLVEERLDIGQELYAGVIVDNSWKVRGPVLIFASEGGSSIEEVSARNPERIVKVNVDYLEGVSPERVDRMLSNVSFFKKSPSEEERAELKRTVTNIYRAFKEYDTRSIEVNPLVITTDGKVVAADCHITLDDNAVFRHPEFGIKLPRDMERPATRLEEVAWTIEEDDYRGTGYFTQMSPRLEGDGWIGFHGIGGGGAMLAASAFVARGLKIANYADTSGDPTASKIYRVVKCILAQPIDGYVLMGSCLANQEQWHHGHALVKVFKEEAAKRPGLPVVILIAGNKEPETREILSRGLAGLPLRFEIYGRDYIYDTDFIADRVEALVKEYQLEKAQGAKE
jgi:succinyl-CoA synthetase beta subunit